MTAEKNGLPEFVPVVVVGAGPAGIAAATLLGQYGVETLVLDRHETVYPLPRAVHADDEVFRILARLGVGEEFAAHSRPGHGLRLIDPQMRVLSEIPRSTEISAAHGFPQMNMFDQPELEAMLRANVKRYPKVKVHGNVEVTSVTQNQQGRVRVSFLDRVRGGEQSVQASYVLGCDGASSPTRAAIGAHMYGLPFTQDWLVIDVNTDVDLDQWEGCHQLCNPQRAGTYMRVSETRYRWEFQLVDGETVANYQSLADVEPLIRPWLGDTPIDALELVRATAYTFRAQVASRWRDRNVFLLGDAAHLTPPFVGQGMAAGLRDAMNLTWKLVGVLDGTLPESVLDTYEQERKLHVGGHDFDGRVGGYRHDRRRALRRSDPPCGVPAHAKPAPAGHPGQCRRGRRPRSAQFRTGDQIPQPRRAGWDTVPQPGAAATACDSMRSSGTGSR